MVRLFDNRLALILTVICLPLLFFPKLNLLSVQRETAGLRLDDLVLMALTPVFLWTALAMKNQLNGIEKTLLTIFFFSLFSFVLNRLFVTIGWLHVDASLFYCLRLCEYFLFFYIGACAARFYSIESIAALFLAWNAILMLLQKMQIVGIFTHQGYQPPSLHDRMLGITSFGAEIGLLINLLFCLLIYSRHSLMPRRWHLPSALRQTVPALLPYALLLFCLFLTILTGARIAIFTLIAVFILSLPNFVRRRTAVNYLVLLVTLIAGCAVAIYGISYYSSIAERSSGLLSFDNIVLITKVWNNIPVDYDPIGHEAVSNLGYDSSWWMRIHKWCYALKIYCQHPFCWLQGVGPGFAMAALDGGFLRILTEMGIIGSLLYGRLFYLMAQQSTQLKWMTIAFLCNMIFFDAYLAYKPMSLLFLTLGAASQQSDTNQDIKAVI